MDVVWLAVSLLVSYLIGAFPTSYILTKALTGTDIREAGSRNAGATNVLRTVGKLPAVITLVGDVLKGLIAVLVVARVCYSMTTEWDYDFFINSAALAAVCGHIWPVFLKFRGGKGVATTIGVGLGVAPLLFIPVLLIWVIVFAASKYVSLASIISLLAFPICACIFAYPFYMILFATIICSIVIFKHKENINRLVRGKENKTVLSKSVQPKPPFAS